MIYLELFISFLQVGLFSIGGGYAAIRLIQEQVVVQHSWLTLQQFTDLVTIAEMTPGPLAINGATFVGIRIAGLAGALVALVGCLTPSLVIVSLLAYVYRRYHDLSVLKNVLACLRPAIVALITSAVLTILNVVVFGSNTPALAGVDWIGALSFLAAFLVLRRYKTSPIATMVASGVAGVALNLIF